MAKKASLKSRLKKMQKGWSGATPRRGGFPVPDDTYDCKIKSATLEEAKSSDRLQINWEFVVLDGDYEGKVFHKYDGLDRPESLDFVQGAFETLELDIPDDVEDIGEPLEAAVGLECEVTVKTVDEFTNVYINDLLEAPDEDEEEEDDEEEGEDEEEDAEDEDEEEDEDEDEAEEDDEEEDEEDEEGEDYTEEDIEGMNKKDLLGVIAEDDDLKKAVKKAKTLSITKLRKAVISEWFEE